MKVNQEKIDEVLKKNGGGVLRNIMSGLFVTPGTKTLDSLNKGFDELVNAGLAKKSVFGRSRGAPKKRALNKLGMAVFKHFFPKWEKKEKKAA